MASVEEEHLGCEGNSIRCTPEMFAGGCLRGNVMARDNQPRRIECTVNRGPDQHNEAAELSAISGLA